MSYIHQQLTKNPTYMYKTANVIYIYTLGKNLIDI